MTVNMVLVVTIPTLKIIMSLMAARLLQKRTRGIRKKEKVALENNLEEGAVYTGWRKGSVETRWNHGKGLSPTVEILSTEIACFDRT
jgi:hypothetical protein